MYSFFPGTIGYLYALNLQVYWLRRWSQHQQFPHSNWLLWMNTVPVGFWWRIPLIPCTRPNPDIYSLVHPVHEHIHKEIKILCSHHHHKANIWIKVVKFTLKKNSFNMSNTSSTSSSSTTSIRISSVSCLPSDDDIFDIDGSTRYIDSVQATSIEK